MQEYILDYDYDCHAVTFANIRTIIGARPYGHPWRLGIEILAETGMRDSVMVSLGRASFQILPNGLLVLTFKPGKNQKGPPRRCALSRGLTNECLYYFENRPWSPNKVFPFSQNSFEREFAKLRLKLGGDFIKKRPDTQLFGKPHAMYFVQLKGIRKTFMTKLYWDLVPDFGETGAIHAVAHEMRHSSINITVAHYLKELRMPEFRTELEQYRFRPISDAIKTASQEMLSDYCLEPEPDMKLSTFDTGTGIKPRLNNDIVARYKALHRTA